MFVDIYISIFTFYIDIYISISIFLETFESGIKLATFMKSFWRFFKLYCTYLF